MLTKVPWRAVVRPRSEGGQYPCLYFSLAGGAQFVPFYSVGVDPFSFCFSLLLSSHFVTSVLVACLRCELRPSLVRPLAST